MTNTLGCYRALGPRAQGLSTYEKECFAILLAIDHWRPYLQHSKFTIKTDQKSLIHLDDQRLSTPIQHKALTKLMGLKYKIVYKKGVENRVTNALSRTNHADAVEFQAISVLTSPWLQQLQKAYLADPSSSKLLQDLAVSNSSGP